MNLSACARLSKSRFCPCIALSPKRLPPATCSVEKAVLAGRLKKTTVASAADSVVAASCIGAVSDRGSECPADSAGVMNDSETSDSPLTNTVEPRVLTARESQLLIKAARAACFQFLVVVRSGDYQKKIKRSARSSCNRIPQGAHAVGSPQFRP